MLTAQAIKDLLFSASIENVLDVIVKNNQIFITLVADSRDSSEQENLIHKTLKDHVDISKIRFIFTSHSDGASSKKKHYINGVSKVIIVASGKGGVGKSTIAAAIAETYVAEGFRVGIVDADIYGPSIPIIFGIDDKPEIQNQKFIPLESRGIKVMSVGFLVDPEISIAWRGPMVSKVLYQMLSTTDWGKLDYIIIDMPPGTGDIHLSLVQNYNIDGAILVTTPQNIAFTDAQRAAELYHKFDIPILHIVENMSDIFPGNAGEKLHKKYKAPYHKVKFNRLIAENIDSGVKLELSCKIL